MRTINSEIAVNASAQAVWDVLMDFEAYPEWNPMVVEIAGGQQVGDVLQARLELPGGPGMSIKPEVTLSDPGRAFRWLGHMLVPGLFDGEHIFELEVLDGGRTLFVQREEFGGVLAGLMLRMIGAKTEAGFVAMNRALKDRVETADGGGASAVG